MIPNKPLQEELRRLAAEKGATSNAKLAKMTGISEPTMSRIFSSNPKNMTEETTIKLSETLGISVARMMALALGKKVSRLKGIQELDKETVEYRLAAWLHEAPLEERNFVIQAAKAYGFSEE
jgi:transcriptional regulator with XRE-family HTH domain